MAKPDKSEGINHVPNNESEGGYKCDDDDYINYH